jgi:hypothetical protein
MAVKNYIINSLMMGALTAVTLGMGSIAISPVAEAAQAVKADRPQSAALQYSLKFDAQKYTKKTMQVEGQAVSFRAYEDCVYVAKPADAAYEKMNIYIPESYFSGGAINGYTAKTAPIFMPNNVGGYMPGQADSPSESGNRHEGANATLLALSKGYVVAAPAIRGRTLQASDGTYTGKAPALIVDYKAAVRYLRYNKNVLPAGDTEKIISNGTSAGGALSALLGATGNSKEYDSYLKEIGAAKERDDIFASSDYCPITNLEHADMAYEWVFNGVNEYHQKKGMGMPGHMPGSAKMPPQQNGQPTGIPMGRPADAPMETTQADSMSAVQIKASSQLKQLFPAYVNSLGLTDKKGNALTLDANGNGSFKEYLESFYLKSAQTAIDSGEDLSKMDWLTIEDGKAVAMDLAKYAVFATRLKSAPAFDSLDNTTGENNEFGTKTINNQHFTEFSQQNSTVSAAMADKQIIKLMNPMNYIGSGGDVKLAKHWRIRHGAIDRDTSLAIPAILATKLMDQGYDVDFAAPWNRGHDGDYDLKELFAWLDSICKAK